MFEQIYFNASRLGFKIAILNGNSVISYADIKKELDEKKAWYESTFKNKNVGVVAGNLWETVILILLAAQSKSRIILLGDNLRRSELDYYKQNLMLDFVFITEDKMNEFGMTGKAEAVFSELNRLKCIRCDRDNSGVDATNTVYEESDYIIQLTSGSEGISKAVARSEESLEYEIINTCKSADFIYDDVFMTIPPISHSYGLVLGMLLPLYMGKEVILMETFNPDLIENYLTEYKVNVFVAVPFMYHIISRRLSINREKLFITKCFSAGGLLDEEISKEFYRLTGSHIWNDYGTTETGLICLEKEGKPNRVGKAILGVKLDVLDSEGNDVGLNKEGIIHVSSKSISRGYVFPYILNREKFFDGIYCTGDVGRMDEQGLVSIEGRYDDLFIVGGEKTSATEIKRGIMQMNEVCDAEVVSEKNAYIGDVVVAYIVKSDGCHITEKDVIKHCEKIMEKYKIPKKIHFVQEIPQNKNGKILRKYLIASSVS